MARQPDRDEHAERLMVPQEARTRVIRRVYLDELSAFLNYPKPALKRRARASGHLHEGFTRSWKYAGGQDRRRVQWVSEYAAMVLITWARAQQEQWSRRGKGCFHKRRERRLAQKSLKARPTVTGQP